MSASSDAERVYACPKCRTALFMDEHLAEHEQGVHKHSIAKTRNQQKTTDSYCSSYFLKSKLRWMEHVLESDKLNCPKCLRKIGSLNWEGSQCSCGTWVSPSIRIPKSKVDVRVVSK